MRWAVDRIAVPSPVHSITLAEHAVSVHSFVNRQPAS
eukprot:COSAG02_NODE_23461_length_718_cov_0.859451_1_plen_36_part_01